MRNDERLHNGIRLSGEWPPRTLDPRNAEPLPAPYLEHPPHVIPIDVGRQLLVDDFLVGSATLEREFHRPTPYDGNPVLRPETELEMNGGRVPLACPFGDGVFHDPQDQLFKMWYHAGWFDGTALAVSRDGIHWERPEFDVVPGTNRVVPRREDFRRDGVTVWLDHDAADPAERFKMFLYARSETYGTGGRLWTSPDGIHWAERVRTDEVGDNTSMFYNPFRRKWVLSIRTHYRGRTRDYREHEDFLRLARWGEGEAVYWAGVDKHDPPDPSIREQPQLYKVEAAAYESIMLGLFQMHYGPPNEVCSKGGFPKLTEIQVAFSRDGFHWHRPWREAFIPATRQVGDWDRAYVHAAGGCAVVVGDQLFLYYSGWSGKSPALGSHMYADGCTGVAFLRRDGFASMNANADGGALTTRPLSFSGKHLFVNVDCPNGTLRAAVLDAGGRPLEPFTLDRCVPVSANATLCPVEWRGVEDLSQVAGRPVKLRLQLASGRLYSFWVSPEPSGASHGFVAGGGPGWEGGRDTRGRAGRPGAP